MTKVQMESTLAKLIKVQRFIHNDRIVFGRYSDHGNALSLKTPDNRFIDILAKYGSELNIVNTLVCEMQDRLTALENRRLLKQ